MQLQRQQHGSTFFGGSIVSGGIVGDRRKHWWGQALVGPWWGHWWELW
jgi:hypothetical protein